MAAVSPAALAQYGLVQVAEFPPAGRILYSPAIDLDHDGLSEMVLQLPGTSIFKVFERTQDAWQPTMAAHTLTIPGSNTLFVPTAAADTDQDGKSELLVHGRAGSNYSTSVYESVNATSYPTDLVWEIDDGTGWEVGLYPTDLDHDGHIELITAGQGSVEDRILVFENRVMTRASRWQN
jgi:hypothetical protein